MFDQRREEAHQRGDRDLRLHAVAHDQHQDRRLGDDRDRVEHHAPPGRRSPAASCCARTRVAMRDRRQVAEQEAAERLDRGGQQVVEQHVALGVQRLQHRPRRRRDEGLDVEDHHHRPPQQQQPDDAQRRQQAAAPPFAALRRAVARLFGRSARRPPAPACPGRVGALISRSPAARRSSPVSATNSGALADGQRAVGRQRRPARSRARGPGWPPSSARAGRGRPPRGCCG